MKNPSELTWSSATLENTSIVWYSASILHGLSKNRYLEYMINQKEGKYYTALVAFTKDDPLKKNDATELCVLWGAIADTVQEGQRLAQEHYQELF